MKKAYVITAPAYSNSNGVRVLYKLADELQIRGYNVYIFGKPTEQTKDKYKFINKVTSKMRKNDIAVYPEVYRGNPLKFQNVVRYVLYYPGVNGGLSVYDEYEFPFVYHRNYYAQGDLLQIPTMDYDIFYKDENVKKDLDCYFVHKGGKWREIKEFENMVEINMSYPSTRKELGDLLRRTKTFYSYDNATQLLDEALACGCECKIVTEKGFQNYSNENVIEALSNYEKQLDNFIQKTQKMNYKGKIKGGHLFEKMSIKCLKMFIKRILKYYFYTYVKKDFERSLSFFDETMGVLAQASIYGGIKDKKLISIIVASYNYGRYLRENLESLINQTYRNIEIIVVDDGSNDDSIEIIKEYLNKDSRVKLVTHENHENRGLNESLKLALKHCNGEYVAFCESDDYWRADHAEKLVWYINREPKADVVACDFVPFGADTKSVEHYTNTKDLLTLYSILKKLKKPEMIYFKTYKDCWVFPTFSVVAVKTEELKKCDFDAPFRCGTDVWLWKQLMIRNKVGFVNEKLTYFRRSGESLVKNDKNITQEEYMKQLNKMIKKDIWLAPLSWGKVKYFYRKVVITIRKLFVFSCLR